MIPQGDPLIGDEEETGDHHLVIRTRWVRQRMWIPELEKLLSEAGGAAPGDAKALREQLSQAVELLQEITGAMGDEIRMAGRTHVMGILVSAMIGIAAVFIALSVPPYSIPAAIIAVLEIVAVFTFRFFQRRLARDLIALNDLAGRYGEPLNAAKNAEDLQKLKSRIRDEIAEALGAAELESGASPGPNWAN